ncbi:MAG: RNA-binding domain-containing protein [Erysipelotrichaceae bacterium]
MQTWDEILDGICKYEKFDREYKKAVNSVPDSVYETYSSFANTNGGIIVLGVSENMNEKDSEQRFSITGVKDPQKMVTDFWSTINSNKVSANILMDKDVYILEKDGVSIVVIEVPRADFTARPVYKGDNPFKGTFKRNHEGDYHAKEYEVRAMIRDQSDKGNDNTILEGYTMDDIDSKALQEYRIMFNTQNPDHVWRLLDDKSFLEMMGGYRKDRREKIEGLTSAGLLMFGKGVAIRDEFQNIFMDYRDESGASEAHRWLNRVTYDGTWENNLFNFLNKLMPMLTEDLKKPFVLENMRRIDDTPVHKAVREACVNMIIHADYRMDSGVLKVVKGKNYISFSNPGNLKLPKEQIYHGGESKTRNPHIQTMLRMVGYGDNAGSGFPDIVNTWKKYGYGQPELEEDTVLNLVRLVLRFDEKDTSVDAEIISDVYYMEEEYERRLSKDERRLSEDSKNERRFVQKMSEVLDPDDFLRMKSLIEYLDLHNSITPKKAADITGRSLATVRRYLKTLKESGFVEKRGNTANIVYIVKNK